MTAVPRKDELPVNCLLQVYSALTNFLPATS